MATEFDILASGYSIRTATPADAKALRMLLPGMSKPGASFVAVDGRHGLVVGAVAASRAFRRQPPAGPGVDLHVVPPARRYGIGRNLIVHLAAAARSAGAAALYGAKRVLVGGDEMLGWQRLGFTACETVEQHRLPLGPLEPQLTPLIERIRRRGRIPPEARIVPLYQADPLAIIQLHIENLGGDRADLQRRLRGRGEKPFLPQYSRVLMVGNEVRGCLLGHRKDQDTMVIDANIVDASLRGGWANVWLKLEAALGVRHLKIRTLEYTTFDRYFDTRNFTKKLGGETTETSALMVLPIDRAAANASRANRQSNVP